MSIRTERNAFFRKHHYRWQQVKGRWILLGPDGWRTNEEEAERLIQQADVRPSPQQWAQEMIEQRPLILDTETTGLDPAKDEIIDIALVELDGTVVLDTLVQCQQAIPVEVTKIHGISDEMLQGKPMFPDMWEQLLPHLSRPLVIYNAAFDIPMLAYGAFRYHIRMDRPDAHCLMTRYAEYHGGLDGAYQRLGVACQKFEIDLGTHRALSDAQAARQVLLHLAAV
ncbi:MAG TPA: 3'-5' exonuclease [Ktedonobacteraceae bacterium]